MQFLRKWFATRNQLELALETANTLGEALEFAETELTSTKAALDTESRQADEYGQKLADADCAVAFLFDIAKDRLTLAPGANIVEALKRHDERQKPRVRVPLPRADEVI